MAVKRFRPSRWCQQSIPLLTLTSAATHRGLSTHAVRHSVTVVKGCGTPLIDCVSRRTSNVASHPAVQVMWNNKCSKSAARGQIFFIWKWIYYWTTRTLIEIFELVISAAFFQLHNTINNIFIWFYLNWNVMIWFWTSLMTSYFCYNNFGKHTL